MKRIGWKRLLVALILSVLLPLCVSCASCPERVEVPLDWPEFPAPGDDVILAEHSVIMSLEYWEAITVYAVQVARVREIVGETIER